MDKQLCKCLKCGNELENYQDGMPFVSPIDGLSFIAYGQYGSTVFDPMDGSWLQIVVCDDCVVKYFLDVAPHKVEQYRRYLGHGDQDVVYGLVGNKAISDDQPFHPDLDITEDFEDFEDFEARERALNEYAVQELDGKFN